MPPSSSDTPARGQFALLGQRRFGPFFWTQLLGAANDNLFKFALTVWVTYYLSVAWLPPAMAGLVIGALFILPFVLLSATAGQLADRWDKARLFRWVKNWEIAIMALAAWAFWVPTPAVQVPVLLLCVLLMGMHSAIFGPAKFAYLPQVLAPRELTGGNALVEMGTFAAIVLGNMAGGLLISLPEVGAQAVAVTCLALALLGRWRAQAIPASAPVDAQLRMNFNPVSETMRNLRLAGQDRVVLVSLLGISWMWFFGAVFLSQFPFFAKEVLRGNAHVASLLLVVFSVGVGTGALLCERLSHGRVEIGLVPLGALGMSVFAIDLYLATRALAAVPLWSLAGFVAQPAHWRVLLDLWGLALAAGIYSVPMFAMVQLRSPASHRARIIAANNILNALFMVASSVLAAALLALGLSVPEVFLATGVSNAIVVGWVFWQVPTYALRCVAWCATGAGRHAHIAGIAQLAAAGSALVHAPHSPQPLVWRLWLATPRPLYWVLPAAWLHRPVLGALWRRAGAIADSAPHAGATAAQWLAQGRAVAWLGAPNHALLQHHPLWALRAHPAHHWQLHAPQPPSQQSIATRH